METIELLVKRLKDSCLLSDKLIICWHAGEPLICGIEFYREAFKLFSHLAKETGISISHSIQTNGTLITEDWVKLFRSHDVHIGISIDGPAQAHDAFRVTRSGKGTHAKTLIGLRALVEAEVSFGAISVVGEYAIDHPELFHKFFEDEKIPSVGLNVPEIEGKNQNSIITNDDIYVRFKSFITNIYHLSQRSKIVSYREIKNILDFAESGGVPRRSSTATSGHILNISYDGNYSTFSPELLSMKDIDGRDFFIGNVYNTSINDALESSRALELQRKINIGIKSCKTSCGLFDLCGGGSPSNKLAENGSMETNQTAFCQLSQRAVFEAVRDASMPLNIKT